MTYRDESTVLRKWTLYELNDSGSSHPDGGVPPHYESARSHFDFDMANIFSGGDLPRYKQIIKQGGSATNNATGQRLRWQLEPCFGSHTLAYKINCTPDGSPVPVYCIDGHSQETVSFLLGVDVTPGPASDNDDALNRAKAQFVSRAHSVMTQFQSGVFLGELRDTIRLIRRPAKLVSNLVHAYHKDVTKHRRGFRKASTQAKNNFLQDKWLTYSLGIRPLVADTQDAALALAKYHMGPLPRVPVSASASGEEEIGNFDSAAGSGNVGCSYTVGVKDTYKARVFGAVSATSSQASPQLQSLLGLNVQDILPTVWNLIPYSFVVDYFVNIDDIIEAASFCTANLAYWGASSKSQRVAYTYNIVNTTSDFPSDPDYASFTSYRSLNPGKSSWTWERFNRTEYIDLVPSLQFKLPGSKRQYANLVALATRSNRSSF